MLFSWNWTSDTIMLSSKTEPQFMHTASPRAWSMSISLPPQFEQTRDMFQRRVESTRSSHSSRGTLRQRCGELARYNTWNHVGSPKGIRRFVLRRANHHGWLILNCGGWGWEGMTLVIPLTMRWTVKGCFFMVRFGWTQRYSSDQSALCSTAHERREFEVWFTGSAAVFVKTLPVHSVQGGLLAWPLPACRKNRVRLSKDRTQRSAWQTKTQTKAATLRVRVHGLFDFSAHDMTRKACWVNA